MTARLEKYDSPAPFDTRPMPSEAVLFCEYDPANPSPSCSSALLPGACAERARWLGEGDGPWAGLLLAACHRHRGMLRPPPGSRRRP